MNLDDLVILMKAKPYLLEMGAGKLSKQYKTTREAIYKAKDLVREVKRSQVKILILDIETTPLEAYVFQTQVWKARINDDSVISRWFMLTWSAKWLGSNKTMSMRVTGQEALEENDGRIVKGIWKLLDEADIVIAHNGDNFDIPNLNTRFLVNGLYPTKPYRTIDTLKVAQRQFGFTHNSLNALGRVFNLGEKIETSFSLWKKAKNGNEDALQEMEIYNRGDVELLEKVYLKMRPWIKRHPNVGVYMESTEKVCSVCGSEKLVPNGVYTTNSGVFTAYKCNDCGSTHTRERKNTYPSDKKPNLLAPIPR
jgi:DNA polymerase elongation subunit (family B)